MQLVDYLVDPFIAGTSGSDPDSVSVCSSLHFTLDTFSFKILHIRYMAFRRYALWDRVLLSSTISVLKHLSASCVELCIKISRHCDQIRQTFPDLFAIEERWISTLLGGSWFLSQQNYPYMACFMSQRMHNLIRYFSTPLHAKLLITTSIPLGLSIVRGDITWCNFGFN